MDRGLASFFVLFVAVPLILLAVALTTWDGNPLAVMGALFLFAFGLFMYPMFVPEAA